MYTLDPTGYETDRDYLHNWVHHQHAARWTKPNVNFGGTLLETIYYEAIQEMVGQILMLLKAKTPPAKYRKDCPRSHLKPCDACMELWEMDFPAAFSALKKTLESQKNWPIPSIAASYPEPTGDRWVRANLTAPWNHQDLYTKGFMLAFNYPDIYARMWNYRNELMYCIK